MGMGQWRPRAAVVVTRLGLTLAALVVTRLGLTLAAVVVAGLRLAGVAHVAGGVIRPVSVATMVVAGLRLAAVPHVAGRVVRLPCRGWPTRVVGAVVAVVAGRGRPPGRPSPCRLGRRRGVRRMGGVVIGRFGRRPGSEAGVATRAPAAARMVMRFMVCS